MPRRAVFLLAATRTSRASPRTKIGSWRRGWDSNPHAPCGAPVFKTGVLPFDTPLHSPTAHEDTAHAAVRPGSHGILDGVTKEDRRQYYLRAEPTDEGRALLRVHQGSLARVFRDLRLNPRLTRPDDLHWTILFLGSLERWRRALHALRVRSDIRLNDLLAWTDVPELRSPPPAGTPRGFDVFFKETTDAVFVLHLGTSRRVVDALVKRFREYFRSLERNGAIPGGATDRLFHHRAFPLARDLAGGKPHVTLARGRVSRDRQRDVLRTIRSVRLASQAPITFARTELRVVQSPVILRAYG